MSGLALWLRLGVAATLQRLEGPEAVAEIWHHLLSAGALVRQDDSLLTWLEAHEIIETHFCTRIGGLRSNLRDFRRRR